MYSREKKIVLGYQNKLLYIVNVNYIDLQIMWNFTCHYVKLMNIYKLKQQLKWKCRTYSFKSVTLRNHESTN